MAKVAAAVEESSDDSSDEEEVRRLPAAIELKLIYFLRPPRGSPPPSLPPLRSPRTTRLTLYVPPIGFSMC